jgi:hypothetical protein
MNWQNQFRDRIKDFEKTYGDGKGIPISIKLRSNSCFCREHHAKEEYKIIDKEVNKFNSKKENAVLIEHESGPEILVYLQITAGTIMLSAAIINLITAIINSRKRTKPGSYFELIVRKFDKEGNVKEEKIIKTDKGIDENNIKSLLEDRINKLIE